MKLKFNKLIKQVNIFHVFLLLVILVIIFNYKKIYIRSLFLIYDIYSLGGNMWKLKPECCSVMTNDFYTDVSPELYSEFNNLIYNRIETGDNTINRDKVKVVCNKMLKELQENKIEYKKPKQIRIIDLNREYNAKEKIREYIKNDIPFVIRNLHLEVFKLSFNDLNESIGEEKVLFTPSLPNCPKGYIGKFNEISTNNCYLPNVTSIFSKNAEILKETDVDKLKELSGGIMDTKSLFVGRQKGTGTPLHSAFTNNFFINVDGEKTWNFFNPNNTPLLYPFFSESGVYNASDTRFLNHKVSNVDKFPLMKYADYFEYTIKPGEILYNPSSWWHSVYNETQSTIAISTRWSFPWNFMHNRDNGMIRCGNLRNKNLRDLAEKLYVEYDIMGINVIDEHNVLGNGNDEIPVWDKIVTENYLLCADKDCSTYWH